MPDKKLQLRNVLKRYGGRTVVDIDQLTLGRHGVEGLIGPNGAGKTTLMSLITGKTRMDRGQILYFPVGTQHDISSLAQDEIARLGLVKTNQIIQDFESLSIVDSMLLSVSSAEHESFYKIFSERELERKAKPEIEKYLEYFRFSDPEGHALSAGEKKLLDIIRCLLLKPRFLLMDEPTVGLPHDQTEKVMELMKRMARDDNMSILIIEHDLDLIWNVSEYVHFMANGQILAHGLPEEIRANKMVEEKYIGEAVA